MNRLCCLVLLLAVLAAGGAIPGGFGLSATPASAQATDSDSDNDGFADHEDYCPNEPGGEGTTGPNPNQPGCPPRDADGDGYGDSQDGCPNQPGGPQGSNHPQGCPPPPDSDGDGFADNQDSCPGQPGGAAGPNNAPGCPPPPDSDGDGFVDPQDACPAQPGPPQSSENAQGCQPLPPPDGGGDGGPTPDDEDGDGVKNADDRCASTRSSEPTDAEGCGPFGARATFGARDTKEMQDEPGLHGQCENARGEQCTFSLTVKLSKASARRLGVKRKIVDVTFTTDKSTFAGKYVYNSKPAGLKRAVERAFKRAYKRNIAVTMTFTGTLTRGSGAAVALPKSTFTMKRKPPGGSAYRVEPSVAVGPDGPEATGLTRPQSPDDY